MRKWFRIVFAVGVLAIVGLIAWAVLTPREPVYQGKPLSVWLEGYTHRAGDMYPMQNSETDEAIRQMGTNVIPTLLKKLKARDSEMKMGIVKIVERQNMVRIEFLASWYGAQFPTGQAVQAFEALGAKASNAVLQLIQTYRENISPESQWGCIVALVLIGPSASPAIPDLLGAATNRDIDISSDAFVALGKINSEPKLVVPFLIKSLQDTNSSVRFCSADALAKFGSEAKPAVPALIQLLYDPKPGVRTHASKALQQIDPEAAAKAVVKLDEARDRAH